MAKQGARVRAVAAEVVDAVVASGRSLDTALANAEGNVAPTDRPLLRMMCFGTIRRYFQISEWIEDLVDRPMKKRDSVVRALLAVGLFQLVDTRIPDHAAVSQTVEAARLMRRPRHAGLLNAIMRRFVREKISERQSKNEQARLNHPRWLIERLRADWPDDWESVVEENNARAPMFLRVNSARVSPDDYLKTLAAADIEAEPAEGYDARSAPVIRLVQAMPVGELPGFTKGVVSVQDAAAQLAAPWLLDGHRGRVLDACSAPGGKSAHLKEIGGADIELTCVDIDPKRLDTVHENLTRLGLDATVAQGDASKPGDWWDGQAFDAILCDAPCSATGVIRRHPDIKLLRREDDIDTVSGLQSRILEALWAVLAPGGRLLYVTCSVLAAENDAVVHRFLDAHEDARENDMLQNNNIRDLMRQKACGYQVLPGTRGMDGFYFACLEKHA